MADSTCPILIDQPEDDLDNFEYLTGSIENNIAINKMSDCVLPKNSIQGHICEIMEGGQEAFNLRKNKYNM